MILHIISKSVFYIKWTTLREDTFDIENEKNTLIRSRHSFVSTCYNPNHQFGFTISNSSTSPSYFNTCTFPVCEHHLTK